MKKFILRALTGPVKGQKFPLKNGLQIGRFKGDILLQDELVSSLHAEISVSSKGKILIFDKDSKNQIIMEDQRVVKSILKPGSKFQIGQTEFQLELIPDTEELWALFIKKAGGKIQDQAIRLQAFAQAIEFVFLSGPQEGQTGQLFYGPRVFGSRSLDFPIFEKKAPAKAFALIPGPKGSAFFATKHPATVQLNGKKVKKAKIKDGDKISVRGSTLKINIK